jgi:hypothetical protein
LQLSSLPVESVGALQADLDAEGHGHLAKLFDSLRRISGETFKGKDT